MTDELQKQRQMILELLSQKPLFTHEDGCFRIGWSQHSLVAYKVSHVQNTTLSFELPLEVPVGKEDFFEAVLFCDQSSETEVFVENQKATVFSFGDKVTIKTPNMTLDLKFELVEGKGDFCGHIFKSNRPTQPGCKGPSIYESYDWQIGMRTLRRDPHCIIQLTITPSQQA